MLYFCFFILELKIVIFLLNRMVMFKEYVFLIIYKINVFMFLEMFKIFGFLS